MRRRTKALPAGIAGLGLATLIAGTALAAQPAATAKPAEPKPAAAKPAGEKAAMAKAPMGKAPLTPAAAVAGELNVTVTYKGKGLVGKDHEITVYLFDGPEITSQSQPVAHQILVKNGTVAHFTGLTLPTAYVAVVYDESGKYEPNTGPPPSGTPIAVHGQAGPGTLATGVNPGKGAKVTMAFDDTRRMP